jgi:hypothetical protein
MRNNRKMLVSKNLFSVKSSEYNFLLPRHMWKSVNKCAIVNEWFPVFSGLSFSPGRAVFPAALSATFSRELVRP